MAAITDYIWIHCITAQCWNLVDITHCYRHFQKQHFKQNFEQLRREEERGESTWITEWNYLLRQIGKTEATVNEPKVPAVHLLRNTSGYWILPVHPRPDAHKVTNSAKSVLVAAKAIVSEVRFCCGAAQRADREGWDSPPLPSHTSASSDGTPAFQYADIHFGLHHAK